MSKPGVVVAGPAKARPRAVDRGWKVVGWFGALLAAIGLTDVALYWYPLAFGSPEWQFGTVAQSFGALPLATIGLAAMAAALYVNHARMTMLVTAALLLGIGLLVMAALAMFVMNVPMALQAAQGAQAPAVHRGIVRTTIRGVGFGSAYLIAGIMMFRHLSRRSEA